MQDVRGLSVVGPGARFCGCLPVAVDDFPGAGMFRNRKVGTTGDTNAKSSQTNPNSRLIGRHESRLTKPDFSHETRPSAHVPRISETCSEALGCWCVVNGGRNQEGILLAFPRA